VLERSGPDVSITVRDHGGWKTTTSPDRGRGLELMRELMDAVEIEAGDLGSTIAMRRRLRAPSTRPAVAGAAG
jgi:anti-sigma regulatory factor (Ser/Thr protein kinase)